ncbi:NUDIX domain-containing protein [Paenibacillus thiaminolyticus]|uniref:NUDIX domain-containing protein n=1 Tax=Paenibacillus thiaminolyticus TaxID=49283 RepID=A0AAP9DTD8_PANTH|nr:NUDIX domain-containing protein [Paenibacillus thiaminolyticus]MCY9537420.1 NUDIX domain-containing protein [Paenibacillus thiaminolyticus]MCY9601107.1 NUDIX domain-containing protein [Paenibacillus thiaminolyticus]MCY9607429.1 NUDIX domain-containing protein [Paenibacillus thiaminolyticus]MCY9613174.1 NUDIX domain-containing protein [Paenibacillus thiaminolyticus]MCY9617589.1 NUDIX domain-containing protein [Paenibacillus thiaminolyticus]
MQGYNVLLIYNKDMDRLLMCKRVKDPYKGLSNLVGGKIERGETGMEAAYRELLEETSISQEHVTLHHLMDFTYYVHDCYVEVYVGKLKCDVVISGDENELYWSDLHQDFFDMTLFAGEGNIGHMIEQVKMSKDKLLADETLQV